MDHKLDRRLVLGLVCMTDVINFSKKDEPKHLDKCIKASMPEGTSLIARENDFERGSLKFIIHNPEFEEVPPGCELEVVLIKPQEPEKSVRLAYNH